VRLGQQPDGRGQVALFAELIERFDAPPGRSLSRVETACTKLRRGSAHIGSRPQQLVAELAIQLGPHALLLARRLVLAEERQMERAGEPERRLDRRPSVSRKQIVCFAEAVGCIAEAP
jgi:hypothetical protein